MKFFLGLLIGLLAAIGIAAGAVYYAFGDLKGLTIGLGDDHDRGDDVTRTLDLVDFDRIDIGGVYEIEVTVGGEFSVELSGSQDELDLVEAGVVEGELVLGRRDEKIHIGKNRGGVTARISMPALNAISASGVVDGEVRGVNSEAFSVAISGVGDMDVAGECGSLNAEVSGVGELDAEELKCRVVRVQVSGVGGARVYASESADAAVSGMGDIDIYGSPANVSKNGGMFSDISVH